MVVSFVFVSFVVANKTDSLVLVGGAGVLNI
jgi:hypothetical protein